MQETVMELLRALSSPDMDIKKKVLQIAMDLVSQRSVDEFITYLKKELMKTQGENEKVCCFKTTKNLDKKSKNQLINFKKKKKKERQRI